MTRFKLTIEYDGRPYVGWQRQNNGPSIQQSLEEAIYAFCQEEVRVHGSGRTDAGVHALGQVAHVDIVKDATAYRVKEALNAHLKPAPIAVLSVDKVADDFDARFSALGRAYRYRIVNRRPPLTFMRGLAVHVYQQLDADAMHEAAQMLVGRHDFTSFRASECQAKSPVKTLTRLDVRREGEEVLIEAEARSFLHHQIRNFAGTLIRVGIGKWSAADVKRILEARDRRQAGPTAPSDGLYFLSVRY